LPTEIGMIIIFGSIDFFHHGNKLLSSRITDYKSYFKKLIDTLSLKLKF
jgi:hypothetical protein